MRRYAAGRGPVRGKPPGPAGTACARHTVKMAYDEGLAQRIRELVEGEPGLAEKRMFGGLAFLVGGNMAVSASGQGGLLLRIDPMRAAELVEEPHVRRAVMRGRVMDGWLRVDDEVIEEDAQLRRWVDEGLDFARALPPK